MLVDRIWPRGVTKAAAKIDLWFKDVAPSSALRKWFGHDPSKWAEFKKRYTAELRAHPAALNELKSLVRSHKTITLLFGAKDEEHNQAVVLQQLCT